MIIIENYIGRKYIAGVLESPEKASELISSISNSNDFRVIELKEFSFPMYAIEDKDSFIYYNTIEAITEWKQSLQRDPYNEDSEYAAVYIFEKEFISNDLNVDEMGGIVHIHIDNSTIDRIEEMLNT
jgi:hypothetical protein